MKERPILFNGPMVRALLDGRKTMTRRIVKPRKCPDIGCEIAACEIAGEINKPPSDWRFSPYGKPGDRLYVKEAWRTCTLLDEYPPRMTGTNSPFWYEATASWRNNPINPVWGTRDSKCGRYRHARFMPKWASRITLEITDVRVARLQEISNADAMAEGVPYSELEHSRPDPLHAAQFADLWESINGDGSWDANPWVWVVEFKRIDQPTTAEGE